ncbi:MAG TPA: family 16 glycosylhydrolase [Hyphomonadaceae bacterium]|nr:family 16 glycosylhydrolase [Hyphomonadaceae bacterium]
MKSSKRHLGIAVGVASVLAIACGVALDNRGRDATMSALADEPVPAASPAKNTGRTPGAAFLMDLSKGHDPDTQYLSNYDLHAGWTEAVFREDNIKFGGNGMTLHAEREQAGKLKYTSAEFQKTGFYGYGRYEVVMRSSNAVGVVSSFFTHTDGYFGDPHDEIDFEFIGRVPRSIHTNIFHDDGGNSVDIPLWFDPSAGEHLYAFEWSPDAVRWYVDNVKIREVTRASSKAGLPTASSRVMSSLWASYGESEKWVGAARFSHAQAFYRCMSHVPMGEQAPQCSDTFKPPKAPPKH